jgi:CMP-N-acetylneuraminic acid synthetase
MVATRRRLAVIPARGGSKRLPGKNLVVVGGRPMIEWSIAAAIESSSFDRVVVSTDDHAIADVARQTGAEVPFMRTEHADDHAPVSLVTIDAVERLRRDGDQFDTVTQLSPSCPLRAALHIRDAAANFDAGTSSFQLSCFQFGWMNPWWAFKRRADGTADPLFADALKQRSQDLEPLYCPSGAIWMARTQALLDAQTFYGPGARFWPLPWQAALDIDDAGDLAMAAAVFATTRHA